MRQLTRKQRGVLEFIARFRGERGFPPTLQEIGRGVGVANVSAVRGHLAALEKKGYITKEPDKARSIQVIQPPSVLSRIKRRLHELVGTDEGVLHKVVYGLALATRGRRPLLVGPAAERLAEALDRRCTEHGWVELERRIEPDHVVLVLEVWPNHSAGLVERRVRAACEGAVRASSPAAAAASWADGYAVTTHIEQLEEMVGRFLDQVGASAGRGESASTDPPQPGAP